MAGGGDVEGSLREYENRRRPVAYRVVELSRRGMFTNGAAGLESDEVDPSLYGTSAASKRLWTFSSDTRVRQTVTTRRPRPATIATVRRADTGREGI